MYLLLHVSISFLLFLPHGSSRAQDGHFIQLQELLTQAVLQMLVQLEAWTRQTGHVSSHKNTTRGERCLISLCQFHIFIEMVQIVACVWMCHLTSWLHAGNPWRTPGGQERMGAGTGRRLHGAEWDAPRDASGAPSCQLPACLAGRRQECPRESCSHGGLYTSGERGEHFNELRTPLCQSFEQWPMSCLLLKGK